MDDAGTLHGIDEKASPYWESYTGHCWEQPWFEKWVRQANVEIYGVFRVAFDEEMKAYAEVVRKQMNSPTL